jgi:hypothetical protein
MVKAENCPRFFLFGRRVSCLCCLWYKWGDCWPFEVEEE